MERRQGNPFATGFGRSVPLSEFWSILTSDFGGAFTTTHGPKTTTHASSNAGSSPVLTTMGTTLQAAIPVSTITVDTTVLRTSFVTVKVSTEVVLPTSCVDNPSCSGLLPPIVTDTQTTPPSLATKGTQSPSSGSAGDSGESATATGTGSDGGTTSTPTASADSNKSSITPTKKHAIIGGLSGSIAGLVLIGVFIIFFLRRRRKRDDHDETASEKGLRPTLARGWSQLTASRSISSAPPQIAPVSNVSGTSGASGASGVSTPDFDGGLISMRVDHWPRPFAHHASFRESFGPSRLRVTNPDLSRPGTPAPRASTESAGSFLRRQRSAVRAVLFGPNRSRASSAAASVHRGQPVPTISIDPALSTEWVNVAHGGAAPSFRSYSSRSSFNVHQQPPEDPFVTPPSEREDPMEAVPPARLRRPSLASMRSAAGAAGRSIGHVGNVLNLFRSKSNVSEPEKAKVRESTSTFSSAGDPFRLDRPSMRASNILQARPNGEVERARAENWNMYEGT